MGRVTEGHGPVGVPALRARGLVRAPACRREAKIPAELEVASKPTLAAGLVARAAGWKIRRAPVLGDL
ncbi:MAG: hypothetical protein ACLP22_00780, partial [Solirubrobacteraceae bacterium]